MTRFTLAVLFSAVIGVAFPGAEQQPAFRTDTSTVPVYATVVDGSGRLVTDLTRDDFDVFDNGKRQELTVFTNDIQPITIVIMLDRSGSMVRNYELVQDAAERFVANLRDDDKVRLGSFSNRIQIDPAAFTSDRNELIRILHDELQGPGTTPLWNATWSAMDALRHEQGRRVVLVFTDGFNTPDWRGMNARFSDVRARAANDGVMVYAIGLADTCGQSQPRTRWPGRPLFQQRRPGRGGPAIPRGPTGRTPGLPDPFGRGGRGPMGRPPVPAPLPPGDVFGRGPGDSGPLWNCVESKPDPDLKELASVSGGGYFELSAREDLGSTFARVADELHQQYLLGFVPATLDGKTHTLEVRLRRPAMTVRARQSYLAQSGR